MSGVLNCFGAIGVDRRTHDRPIGGQLYCFVRAEVRECQVKAFTRRESPYHITVFISEFPGYSIVSSALYMHSEIASKASR